MFSSHEKWNYIFGHLDVSDYPNETDAMQDGQDTSHEKQASTQPSTEYLKGKKKVEKGNGFSSFLLLQ